MRTKALFVAAAFGAAGLVSSMAQVYSVNVVGYVNTVLKPGYNLIANPLETTANTVADLFPGVDGMSVFKFVGGTYQIANFDAGLGEWDNPAITLNPGEGAFVFNPTDGDVTVTFVGEIVEGTKTNELPVGWSMKSSQVPQAGGLVSALGFPVAGGDAVFTYNTTRTPPGYDIANYDEGLGDWDVGEPVIGVGQAFFLNKATAGTWSRNFSVAGN
jgi:hypothetical protein